MRVAVLGGGLQGACVAMELAAAGVTVDLFEKTDRCLSQASTSNEGKIHLGYVYANDPTLCTARTMIGGALRFSSLMRRWIGDAIDEIPVAAPFYYVVHVESLLGVEEIQRHLEAAHAIALEESRALRGEYFGLDYRLKPSRVSETECESLFGRRSVLAAFSTSEVAIDSEALASAVCARLLDDPKITCRLQSCVHGVDTRDDRPAVDFDVCGSRGRERYDHVVNALWEGRLAIDRTAGLEPDRRWLYRLKYYVRLRAPSVASKLPSTTIVLGPFGDVVSYGSDVYLSWYPAGLRGLSSDVTPPDWPRVLEGGASMEMRQATLDGLAEIIPAVAVLTPDVVEVCRQGRRDLRVGRDRHSRLGERPARETCDRPPVSRPVSYRGHGQAHDELEVVISLDGAEPGSEELCRPFLEDSRFRLVVQPEQLGWVGNTNWLMSQVQTPFWCYQAQDDLIDPGYVEALLEHARRAPEAAVVYCDIEAFGLRSFRISQPSVTGGASARQLSLLYAHHSAVAFRGLTRIEALRESGGIRPNEVDDFSADTTWMAAAARWGELHRVPSGLYRKRYHVGN
ncbi:MAG: FAD-dependent oxidoreductase, partial [Gemmatimonadetes bacterium]|nr:FAD-dependent oxidoreductase [Gemmatimonadota bacterium]